MKRAAGLCAGWAKTNRALMALGLLALPVVSALLHRAARRSASTPRQGG